MFEFRGSVAVVTGAASGIGRASALAFAREGADVVVADINEAGVKEVASAIESLGRSALAVRTDVGKRDEVERLVDESIAWQGHCDLFFSNAGVGVGGPPHTIPLQDWEWVIDINLWAHIWAVRRVLPHMLERGSGHLVHTASAAGLMGFGTLAPYCVTKFAVAGLVESLAVYGADKGIGASVVCPMFVSTNIMEGSRITPEDEEDAESIAGARELFARVLREQGIPPERVASAIVNAVRENRLYVLPHPEVKDLLAGKWSDPDEWVRASAQMMQAQRSAASTLFSRPQG